MTTETAPGALAYISAGFTFAVLLVILVGSAAVIIKRHSRSRRRGRERSIAMPQCSHQRLALDACDDAVCVDCGENLT